MSTAATRPRLLCIPGAGASAAKFERMKAAFADLVEVRTFELPGRGIRFAEPSLPTLRDHVTHFVRRIEAEPYQRWILLGESLGAVTSAAVAAELSDSMRADVLGVITVAAAPGETGRRDRDEVMALLEADARGTANGDIVPLVAEAILADIDAAHATADVTKVPRLAVPVATIRGCNDSLVSEEGARRWETLAVAGWRYQEVPGNHYQFDAPSPELIAGLRDAIGFMAGAGVP